MCGGKVVQTDPEAEAQAAADKAVTQTNLKKSLRKPSKDIRKRYPRKSTAQDYYTLFEAHPIGQDVLDDLISIFGGTTYVRGGQDADRETCFRAGRKHVVDHILIQITRTINKYIDRPVYRNVCIDDDGRLQLNELIKSGQSTKANTK